MIDNKKTTQNQRPITDILAKLHDALEREHQALLEADPKAVAAISEEKELLADQLGSRSGDIPNEELSKEVKALSKKVNELAQLNHKLLEHMFHHYNGVVELLMRIAGHGPTYSADGSVSIEGPPKSSSTKLTV